MENGRLKTGGARKKAESNIGFFRTTYFHGNNNKDEALIAQQRGIER